MLHNGGAQQWHKVCRDAKRTMQTCDTSCSDLLAPSESAR